MVLEPSTADVRGSAQVRDIQRRVLNRQSGQVPPGFVQQGRYQAAFRTFTSTGTDDPVQPFGVFCEGVVGVGEESETELFSVGEVRFELGEGPVTLSPDAQQRYIDVQSGRLFTDSVTDVRVSGGGTDTFPAFDLSVPVVTPLTLGAPTADGSFELLPSGFVLRWDEARDGDFVLLSILPDRDPGDTTKGGQVRCVLPDTGCFEVPANMASFLSSDPNALTFTVNLSRVRSLRERVDADTDLDLSVESRVSFTIRRGS
jgi:hypothetical protein